MNRPFRPPVTDEPDDGDAQAEFRAEGRERASDLLDRVIRRAGVAISFLEIGDDRGARYAFNHIKREMELIEAILAAVRGKQNDV